MAVNQFGLINLSIHLLLLILQVDCDSKGENECGKLYFRSSTLGCRLCSLCHSDGKDLSNHSIRKECQKKHPTQIHHLDNRYLWCDDPEGDLPECRSLPESVVQKKFDSCNDAKGRQFPPGCVCTVGCQGEEAFNVSCTFDLQWTNESSIPEACVPTTAQAADTTNLANTSSATAAEKHIILPVVVSCAVLTVILVMVIVVCIYKRRRGKDGSPAVSQSSLETRSDKFYASDAGTQVHLIPAKKSCSSSIEASGVPKKVLCTQGGSRLKSDGTILNGAAVVPHPTEAVEIEVQSPAVENQLPESIALLGREAVQIYPKLHLDMEIAPSEPALIVTVHEKEKHVADKTDEQANSRAALKDLMNSRKHLYELSKMFDQEDAFDKVTWHNIAMDLIGWDPETIHSVEYLSRPCPGSGVPGDGPMYRVLKEAQEQGKGLLSFIHCLKHHQFGKEKAENFLWNYWKDWMSAHAET